MLNLFFLLVLLLFQIVLLWRHTLFWLHCFCYCSLFCHLVLLASQLRQVKDRYVDRYRWHWSFTLILKNLIIKLMSVPLLHYFLLFDVLFDRDWLILVRQWDVLKASQQSLIGWVVRAMMHFIAVGDLLFINFSCRRHATWIFWLPTVNVFACMTFLFIDQICICLIYVVL